MSQEMRKKDWEKLISQKKLYIWKLEWHVSITNSLVDQFIHKYKARENISLYRFIAAFLAVDEIANESWSVHQTWDWNMKRTQVKNFLIKREIISFSFPRFR